MIDVTEQDVRRNVWLYKLYIAFSEPIFWGPIMIITLQKLARMEWSQIYIMEGMVMFGFTCLEIPSGALADIIGRKKTVVLGSFLRLISVIWFAAMQSPFDAIGADVLWMIAVSLRSGADTALVYDALKAVGRENEYKEIRGKAFGIMLFLMAFASLSTGFLAEIHLRLPLILSSIVVAISTFATLFFRELPNNGRYEVKKQIRLMKTSALFVANHKEVKWLIGFSLLIELSSKIWFFTYNPYFELVEIDLRYWGVIFFFGNLTAWFFSFYAYRLGKKIRDWQCFVGMVLLIGCPVFLMGTIVSLWSVSMILLQSIVRGFRKPFLDDSLNKHLESKNRATVLSIHSASIGLASLISLSTFGVIIRIWSLPFCLQLLGLAVLLMGARSILRYRKIFC